MEKFVPWPKIWRDPLTMIITEKMDGTNGQIIIQRVEEPNNMPVTYTNDEYRILVGSRRRYIQPESVSGQKASDNYGFAAWVLENAEVLIETLGIGQHFGEWCGPGIQGNPLKLEKKIFYLFNVNRWLPSLIIDPNWPSHIGLSVVPVLHEGPADEENIEKIMLYLKENSPESEGIVVYYPQANYMRKLTFKYSDGKWKQ